MDTIDKATRSKIMSHVGQKNTAPELRLRKALHRKGLRYRLHDKQLSGSPDIVLPRYKSVIFVHGCFWHRHEDCKFATTPENRRDFWWDKFQTNIDRDRKNIKILLDNGWRVAVVWECSLKGKDSNVDYVVTSLMKWLSMGDSYFEIGGGDLTN